MSASQQLVADDILDAYDFAGCRRIMDVGGGEGGFLIARGWAHAALGGDPVRSPPVAAKAANFDSKKQGSVGGARHWGQLSDGRTADRSGRHLARPYRSRPRRRLGSQAPERCRKALPADGVLLIGRAFRGCARGGAHRRCLFRLLFACHGAGPGAHDRRNRRFAGPGRLSREPRGPHAATDAHRADRRPNLTQIIVSFA